jgi:hypothetical protein
MKNITYTYLANARIFCLIPSEKIDGKKGLEEWQNSVIAAVGHAAAADGFDGAWEFCGNDDGKEVFAVITCDSDHHTLSSLLNDPTTQRQGFVAFTHQSDVYIAARLALYDVARCSTKPEAVQAAASHVREMSREHDDPQSDIDDELSGTDWARDPETDQITVRLPEAA